MIQEESPNDRFHVYGRDVAAVYRYETTQQAGRCTLVCTGGTWSDRAEEACPENTRYKRPGMSDSGDICEVVAAEGLPNGGCCVR